MNQSRSTGRSDGNRRSSGGFNRNSNNQGGSGRSFNNSGRSNFRRNNFSSEDREMHKTVCTKCGKPCEVPFKPTEGKPVYCKECFEKNKRF